MTDIVPPVAVVAALPIEVAGARRAIARRKRLQFDGVRAWVGLVEDRSAVAAAIGLGAARAEAGMSRLLDEFPARAVALVGIGGACAPGLAPGDAVICDPLLCEPDKGPNGVPIEGRTPIAADEDVAAALRRAAAEAGLGGRTRVAPGVTVNVIATPRAKDSLGRNREAAICDMETFFAARACRARGVPFAAVRVVFDALDERVPIVPGLGVDPLSKVLAKHPRAALALPQLALRMAATKRALDPLARAVVRELAAAPI